MPISSDYEILKKLISENLKTVEETLYFIKNFEKYLSDKTQLSQITSSYMFLREVNMLKLESLFPNLRSDLISRKTVKIQAPIILSKRMIDLIYENISISSNKYMIDCFVDSSIVSGLKITLGGSLIDLTLENVNKVKF